MLVALRDAASDMFCASAAYSAGERLNVSAQHLAQCSGAAQGPQTPGLQRKESYSTVAAEHCRGSRGVC